MTPTPKYWRTGNKVALDIYDGDRPICQCHSEQDASRITNAVNLVMWLEGNCPETLAKWRQTMKEWPNA